MSESKEIIHKRMLSNIDEKYDKSEGSFFYDLTKPTAIEIEKANDKTEKILDRIFADTAKDEDLDRVCAQIGIYRKLATKSKGQVIIKGATGAFIGKGNLVASDNVNFVCLEDKFIGETGEIIMEVQCDKEGSIGNVPSAAIKSFPVTIPGAISVINLESINNGYDRETDESLRVRYYVKLRTPGVSGNKHHYKEWALECNGVGDARVFPLANGNGTVKILIINSIKRAADKKLLSDVFNYIEEQRPPGAKVEVVSAIEKEIVISANLVIKDYTLDVIQAAISKKISKYFEDSIFKETYISLLKVGSMILSVDGVKDCLNLKINGVEANLSIGDYEIPILGGVKFE